jgi:hypothetical protein
MQAIVINISTRDRLADEAKQLGKSYCNNGWQINITMVMFVNSNYRFAMTIKRVP